MNIIEVMRLEVGTKVTSEVSNWRTLIIKEQDGTKVLKYENDRRRLFLDNDITEAEYQLVES